MQVIFVRHATAEDSHDGGDARRELTRAGRQEARATAEALERMGISLDAIWTSPLVRAVQTAEGLLQTHRKAEVQTVDWLAPPASFKALRQGIGELMRAGKEAVAVVGHAPSMDAMLARLAAGVDDIGTSLSKSGAACVRLPEAWPDAPAELQWIMHRRQLAMIAKKG